MGLADRAHHRPRELSGGQQQRVAYHPRAGQQSAHRPGDEPTSNLDTATGREILMQFDELNAEGITMVGVTHDQRVADRCRRVIRMVDGRIEKDYNNHVGAGGESA